MSVLDHLVQDDVCTHASDCWCSQCAAASLHCFETTPAQMTGERATRVGRALLDEAAILQRKEPDRGRAALGLCRRLFVLQDEAQHMAGRITLKRQRYLARRTEEAWDECRRLLVFGDGAIPAGRSV